MPLRLKNSIVIMKTTKLWMFLAVVLLLAIPTACSDEDDVQSFSVTPQITKGVRPEAYYKGDAYEAGTGSYWINFIIAATANEVEQVLCVDFNSVLATDPDFACPEMGVYEFDAQGTHQSQTINGEGDSYLARIISTANDDIEVLAITGGTMKMRQESGGYVTVECDFTLEGGKSYVFTYTGPLSYFNRTEEGNKSNLKEDAELKNLTQGFGIYYGDIFEAGSDMWNLILADDKYDINQLYGTGDAMQLAVNVPNGSADYIPEGTYRVLDLDTAETLPPGSMINGTYNPMYGGYWGCWYYNPGRQLESALQTGTLEVSRQNETYTFKVDLCDKAGRHVKARYTGPIKRFEDL